MIKPDKERIWIRFMEAGAMLGCHQMPERSFTYGGYQFPVCARCTGILVSIPAAYMAALSRKKIPVSLCALMVGMMAVDGFLQYIGIKESTNRRRFITGLCGGFGMTVLRWKLVYGICKKIKMAGR